MQLKQANTLFQLRVELFGEVGRTVEGPDPMRGMTVMPLCYDELFPGTIQLAVESNCLI